MCVNVYIFFNIVSTSIIIVCHMSINKRSITILDSPGEYHITIKIPIYRYETLCH